MRNKLFFFTIFFFLNTLLIGQNLSIKGFYPTWNQIGKINDKLSYGLYLSSTIDAVPMTIAGIYYPAKDMQLQVQSSVFYKMNKNWTFSMSYLYQRNNPFEELYNIEHRIWQQAIFSKPLTKGTLLQRFKTEERFIQNRNNNQYPLSTRVRYALAYNMPLKGNTLEVKEFYLYTYSEVIVSLTGAKNATLSDNWSTLGVGYNASSKIRFELGYLVQTSVRNSQKDFRILHLLQMNWITSFDFFKNK